MYSSNSVYEGIVECKIRDVRIRTTTATRHYLASDQAMYGIVCGPIINEPTESLGIQILVSCAFIFSFQYLHTQKTLSAGQLKRLSDIQETIGRKTIRQHFTH